MIIFKLTSATLNQRMLIFDGYDLITRIIKLRPRQINSCIMCQHAESSYCVNIENTKKILEDFDYTQFCGVKNANDKTLSLKLLKEEDRISCDKYNDLRQCVKHLLLDVRPKCQFNICAMPDSINIPIDDFYNNQSKTLDRVIEMLCDDVEIKDSSLKFFLIFFLI